MLAWHMQFGLKPVACRLVPCNLYLSGLGMIGEVIWRDRCEVSFL